MAAPIRTFRDIVAWQRGMALCAEVYAVTRALPREERFGIAEQMRRAATSIPASIAEGYGLGLRPAMLRHLRIARGSLFELQTFLELAEHLHGVPTPVTCAELLAETDRVLQSFIRSLEQQPA